MSFVISVCLIATVKRRSNWNMIQTGEGIEGAATSSLVRSPADGRRTTSERPRTPRVQVYGRRVR